MRGELLSNVKKLVLYKHGDLVEGCPDWDNPINFLKNKISDSSKKTALFIFHRKNYLPDFPYNKKLTHLLLTLRDMASEVETWDLKLYLAYALRVVDKLESTCFEVEGGNVGAEVYQKPNLQFLNLYRFSRANIIYLQVPILKAENQITTEINIFVDNYPHLYRTFERLAGSIVPGEPEVDTLRKMIGYNTVLPLLLRGALGRMVPMVTVTVNQLLDRYGFSVLKIEDVGRVLSEINGGGISLDSEGDVSSYWLLLDSERIYQMVMM